MKLHKLNPIGGIEFALIGAGLGLVGYHYGAAMSSTHSIEPGHAYALLGYGFGLVGALIGVASSKWFYAKG
jgi:hypothetical protein